MTRKNKKSWIVRARAVAPLSLFVLVGVGLALPMGLGTPSSIGWGSIASICPLGALETFVCGGGSVGRVAVGLAISLLLIFLLGRAFCAWLCPVSRIGVLLKGRGRAVRHRGVGWVSQGCSVTCGQVEGLSAALLRGVGAKTRIGQQRRARRKPLRLDSRHAVLVGALASSAAFGFPVFCLACPIGLTFAVFILFWRMLQFGDASWGLLVFPAIVVLELTVLRRWCSKICPVSALMSLVPGRGRLFRVRVDRSVCLRETKGASCEACSIACSEGIDPAAVCGDAQLLDCAKCHRCADACPASAIAFPLIRRG